MVHFGPVFLTLLVNCLGHVMGLEWSSTPPDHMHACAGSTVTFPWNFKVADNETVLSVTWIHDGAASTTVVATMVRDHFMATAAFSGRVRRVEQSNGGLVMEDVTTEDSGNYTLEVQVTTGSVFESLKNVVDLQVADRLMLKGGQLQAGQDPEAWLDQGSQQWFIRLTCGPFTFLGQPSMDVVWTTPDGRTVSSSGYQSGQFYLSLRTPVQGGTYTCSIPQSSLPQLCFREQGGGQKVALSAEVTLDETKARLSLLEANQKTVHQTGAQLQVTLSSMELTHELDIENVTECKELTTGVQDQMGQLQRQQQFLMDKVEHFHNKSIMIAMSGPCRQEEHSVLDESWRSSAVGKTGLLRCDDDLDPGWYRFLLNGDNAVIPTECVPKNRCNTHASEWLDLQGQSLPQLGQEVSARTCAHWDSNCCRWEAPVTVRNCGSFFLYNLKPRSNCHLAHCVEPQNEA